MCHHEGTPATRLRWAASWVVAAGLVAGTPLHDGAGAAVAAQPPEAAPFARRVPVPPLPADAKWLNTSRPLGWKDLRGKFVLVDFWTYCCINCMHILPELEKLEEKYPDTLVVIGVHSAKFDSEKEAENVAEAIRRYHITHPVINDDEHVLWRRFAVRAWPTVLLIDPEGYAVWGTSGEITFAQVDAVLSKAAPYYRRKGTLSERPLGLAPKAGPVEPTPLAFPGKVLADEASGRLLIADSGHNRIVVARLDGTLVDVVGSGRRGRRGGDFALARFNDPQGMALRGRRLYVADTKNHLIRKIDLAQRRVSSIAGTGEQARRQPPLRMGRPNATPLASPWALWIEGEDLYIAMAGRHQIWRMPLDESAIGPYAGNGREDIVDGPLLPASANQSGTASFAQPSGLASDGTWLFVADSEGSSIRAVPLGPGAAVRTVVGTAHLPLARLFTFGDVDGSAGVARLQHPLGIVFSGGKLYLADTYNNKIKVVDPLSGETHTLVGTGQQGATDEPARFDEPAGIAAAGDKLYVADTNNHRIRVVDLAAGNKVSTLTIRGLQPPAAADSAVPVAPVSAAD